MDIKYMTDLFLHKPCWFFYTTLKPSVILEQIVHADAQNQLS